MKTESPIRRPTRPRHGWDALTPTELLVVAGIVGGSTNGELGADLYISRHTVESHLKHIFTKLGVRSRAEVAVHGTLHATRLRDPSSEAWGAGWSMCNRCESTAIVAMTSASIAALAGQRMP